MKRIEILDQLRKRRQIWIETRAKLTAGSEWELANIKSLEQKRIDEIMKCESIDARLEEIKACMNLLSKGTAK